MEEIPKNSDPIKADPIMLEDGSYKTVEDEELDTELMNRVLNPTFIECLKTVISCYICIYMHMCAVFYSQFFCYYFFTHLIYIQAYLFPIDFMI